jgi:hypothetical protein
LAAVVLHKAKQKAATPPITTTKSIPKRNPTKYFPTWGYQIAYFKLPSRYSSSFMKIFRENCCPRDIVVI